MNKKYVKWTATAFFACCLPSLAAAQDALTVVATDTVFILNSLLFLVGGFLVFWMAAGFSMLEAGLVRSKNVTMQLTKNISPYGYFNWHNWNFFWEFCRTIVLLEYRHN